VNLPLVFLGQHMVEPWLINLTDIAEKMGSSAKITFVSIFGTTITSTLMPQMLTPRIRPVILALLKVATRLASTLSELRNY
jgi:hypothetical protein